MGWYSHENALTTNPILLSTAVLSRLSHLFIYLFIYLLNLAVLSSIVCFNSHIVHLFLDTNIGLSR